MSLYKTNHAFSISVVYMYLLPLSLHILCRMNDPNNTETGMKSGLNTVTVEQTTKYLTQRLKALIKTSPW